MSKTGYKQGQPVEYQLAMGGEWHEGTYLQLVPGPESDGPQARVRVNTEDGQLSLLLSSVRPIFEVTISRTESITFRLGAADAAEAEANMYEGDEVGSKTTNTDVESVDLVLEG
jgi:hypothetical protein